MKWTLGQGNGTRRWIKMQQERVPYAMRIFMIEFYRQATISTPVDTGRARLGWNCSVGKPDSTVPPEGKYTLNTTKAANVFTASAVTGREPLYIANAVPYIGALNNGWSKQAPARFVELAFANTVDKLAVLIQKRSWNI